MGVYADQIPPRLAESPRVGGCTSSQNAIDMVKA